MKTAKELEAELAAARREKEAAEKRLADLEQEQAEHAEKAHKHALILVAKIAAFKAIITDLKAQDGILTQPWHDLLPQSYPRESSASKAFDLSETEVANAKAKGLKAVQNL